MPSSTRTTGNLLGIVSPSLDSLYYRPTAGIMNRHGSTTPPQSDNTNSYDQDVNSSSNRDYPLRRAPTIANHTRDPSTYSTKGVASDSKDIPRVFGFPLKYVSYVPSSCSLTALSNRLIPRCFSGHRLVTLALQNASLAIIMHYSRVSVAPDKVYSAASAVLLNEILKGCISFAIAFARLKPPVESTRGYDQLPATPATQMTFTRPSVSAPASLRTRLRYIFNQIASPDSWKLSIPALLYVLQNNLQYIAVSNLDVPTFQITNQMKILTTAGFSVLLLRKRLNGWKWASLALLAFGVGIVQIQSSRNNHSATPPAIELPTEELEARSIDLTDPSAAANIHPLTGFLAVLAACFTSGLAGVYFEMVLKGEPCSDNRSYLGITSLLGSKADLWVRNVQLSLWSLIPALIPVVTGLLRDGMKLTDMFVNFGGWAWCTVLTQVAGGLITALVIKVNSQSIVILLLPLTSTI